MELLKTISGTEQRGKKSGDGESRCSGMGSRACGDDSPCTGDTWNKVENVWCGWFIF
jgi:hypothetical protein